MPGSEGFSIGGGAAGSTPSTSNVAMLHSLSSSRPELRSIGSIRIW